MRLERVAMRWSVDRSLGHALQYRIFDAGGVGDVMVAVCVDEQRQREEGVEDESENISGVVEHTKTLRTANNP